MNVDQIPDGHVLVRCPNDWHIWLHTNHAQTEGVWVVYFRKGSGEPLVTYDQLVEEALCYGWVDSKPGKVNDRLTKLYFAPRKRGSAWARPNKLRVERLLAEGRMHSSGLAKVEAAKADGTWTKLDLIEDLVEPKDFCASLDANPSARQHWDAFPRSARRGILEWIVQAKRAETRRRRIDETVRLADENVRANQWRPG